ncbi:MAG TPA: DNA ligase D [Nitrospiraceae bacterium]|nr:DNA ligase D [Nitrospiraceae bacterium]
MGLRQYRNKRNFKQTPEPLGRAEPSSARWQFVIHKHAASRLHYDFRLELDGTLKSWAVPKGPSLDPSDKRLAVHVEDHPLDYADFEGIIPPKQYGAGTVLLWDRGTWSPIGDPRSGYRRGRLKFRLFGRKLRGAWNLVRMGSRGAQGKENWLLIKEDDEEARRGKNHDITKLTESVASGRSMEQIAADRRREWQSNRAGRTSGAASRTKPKAVDPAVPQSRKTAMAERVRPQLATLVDTVPEGAEWVHELKYDGYRILCSIRDGRAKLWTRNGHDWTSRLQRIARATEGLPVTEAWLDGEIVAVEPDGTISFQALQNAFDVQFEANLVYYLFDLLYLDGYDLRSVALIERKRLLASLLESMGPSPLIRYSDHIEGKGEVVFAEACRRGMEGLVSKKAEASYQAGRNRNWVKVKCGQRQEFVIGGFTEPSGSRVAFGALLLGVYDEQGRLRFVGRTGTGFSERSLRQLHRRLTALEQTTSPFVTPPTGSEARGVHWVRPELVAEVAFAQWTGDGLLRQASFQGLREDKPAKEIVMEQPKRTRQQDDREGRASRARRHRWAGIRAGRRNHPVSGDRASGNGPTVVAGVTLSHPDRVLYPEQGLTKIGLARYYEQAADWILPHLEHRPLTLVRCPEGRAAECFYQKHAKDTVPEIVGRVKVQENRQTSVYMTADSLPALIGLVQMGVLELHTWGARSDLLDRPDRLIIDLDPDPAVPWKSVVEAAQLVRRLFHELELECFLKTTGGKGLHVVAPLQRVHSWEEVKSFSRALAEHLVRLIPDRFVANMSKQKRKGKIYLDFLRNAKGATAIAPYSTRAKPRAPVSVPLTWDELSVDLRSDHFTVANVPDRLTHLRRDPWQAYFTIKQQLTRRMKRALGMR